MLRKVVSLALVVIAVSLFHTGMSPDTLEKLFQYPLNLLNETRRAQSTNTINLWLTIVSCVIVFGFFIWRFGQWRVGDKTPQGFPLHPPRSFTTSMQYFSWAFLYGAVMVTAFLICVYIPEFVSKLLALLNLFLPQQFAQNIDLASLSDAAAGFADRGQGHVYFLGFGLTILGLFGTNALEGMLRAFFHRRAMIPREAENIFSALRVDFHRKPIPDRDAIAAFLVHSRHDPDMPTYHDFELQLGVEQALQNRLELLPRTEFMLWRLKQRGFSKSINQRLTQYEDEIEALSNEVNGLRAVAIDVKRQLIQVLDGFAAIEAAALDGQAGGPVISEEMAILRRVAGTAPEDDRITDIPVSLLDDVALALKGAIARLGDRLSALNAAQTPAAGHNAGDILTEAARLRRQLDALTAGLTPLCQFGLETIDASLSEKQPRLRDLCDRVLAFSVCAALSASTRPDMEFFEDLGLHPDMNFIRFHPGRAAFVVVVPMLFYFGVLVLMGDMQFDPSFFVIDLWLVLGTWMIAGSVLYGCYHGSAVASLKSERRFHRTRADFRLVDCVSAYVLIWSILVIGIFIIAIFYSDENLFAASVPFAFVAAVWGVMTAAASMRTLLNVPPIKLARDMPFALLAVTLFLGMIRIWSRQTGPDGPLQLEQHEWNVLFTIALSLTVFLTLTIWWSVRSDRAGIGVATPASA